MKAALRLTDRAFAVYVLVGVLNTLVGYAVFLAALGAGAGPAFSLAISTLLGIVFNFGSIGRVVFGRSEPSLFGRFVLVYAVLFAANAALLASMVRAGLTPAPAQALLLAPFALAGYALHRRFVFAPVRERA